MTEQTDKQIDTSFEIRRIYSKDISFETPNSPDIFSKEWKQDINIELHSSSHQFAENVFEVALRVTVTGKSQGDVAYICEVTQAGIFAISGLADNKLKHCLGAYCPNILFPYVREIVSSLITRGTFPPINLDPVNFDAVFMNYIQQQANTQTTETASDASKTIQ